MTMLSSKERQLLEMSAKMEEAAPAIGEIIDTINRESNPGEGTVATLHRIMAERKVLRESSVLGVAVDREIAELRKKIQEMERSNVPAAP